MVLNAVYEADSLISAMEKRANDYKNVREQLLVLQKTLDQVAQSHDSFQGEGAEAVQSFYQEHTSLVDEWLTLIDMQVAFHQGVAADAAESNLAGHTYINVEFLEKEVANGYMRSKEMVADQQTALTGILSSISDLVDLQPFDSGPFETHMDKAEKERKNTIEKVDELTEKLTYEYQQSEAIQAHIVNRFKALIDATRQGGQASPVYFDAKAYRNSAAYKMKDGVQHQANAYLSFKKEQAKERRIQELQKQLEKPTLSLDEYLKIAESIGKENLTVDQKEIVRLIKANKQQGEVLKGIGAGVWDFTKDTVVGAWNVLMTPPEQVLYNMGAAIINYDETYAQISAAIASSYESDMVNGTDYTRARWVTYALATVGTSIVGTKGIDKVGRAGFVAGKNAVRETKKVVSSKMKSLNYFSSLTQRYAFAEGFDIVPYNAVNSLGFKEQLETQVYMFFKSMGKEYKNYKGVDFTGSTKVDGEVRDLSRRVYQRLDIDYKRIDPNTGLTNLQLMKKGRAPIWQDGTVIELHHLIQKEPGSMVEIPASMHDEYHKILHGLVENGGSFRNNPVLKKQYDNFRSKYWRWRAKQIDNSKL